MRVSDWKRLAKTCAAHLRHSKRAVCHEAVSAGTRAQRQLQELQEDFRKQNSGHFDERMRDMRESARRRDSSSNPNKRLPSG